MTDLHPEDRVPESLTVPEGMGGPIEVADKQDVEAIVRLRRGGRCSIRFRASQVDQLEPPETVAQPPVERACERARHRRFARLRHPDLQQRRGNGGRATHPPPIGVGPPSGGGGQKHEKQRSHPARIAGSRRDPGVALVVR